MMRPFRLTYDLAGVRVVRHVRAYDVEHARLQGMHIRAVLVRSGVPMHLAVLASVTG